MELPPVLGKAIEKVLDLFTKIVFGIFALVGIVLWFVEDEWAFGFALATLSILSLVMDRVFARLPKWRVPFWFPFAMFVVLASLSCVAIVYLELSGETTAYIMVILGAYLAGCFIAVVREKRASG